MTSVRDQAGNQVWDQVLDQAGNLLHQEVKTNE
jgi:PleD family two-component response regulator